MTHDDFDIDLERRLRSVGRAAPEAPASLDEAAREVTLRPRVGRARPFDLGGRRHGMRWLGAIAAALAVVVLVGSVLRIGTTNRNAAGWTPRPEAGAGEWTAIEWHDVSAGLGGLTESGLWSLWGGDTTVRWAHGYAVLGDQGRWWLSEDGINWRLAPNLQQGSWLGSVGEGLLTLNGLAGAGAWWTVDGEKLESTSVPFDLAHVSGVVSGKPGLIVTTAMSADPSSAMLPGPYTFYFTSDGHAWKTATLPSDLAQARGVVVRQFIDGFIATGALEDPTSGNANSVTVDNGPTVTWHYRETAWYSADGLQWSKYDPQGRTVSQQSQWAGMKSGRLGAGDASIHSTDGGRTWTQDKNPPYGTGSVQLSSNGRQIVFSDEGGTSFYVSEGDGHWTLLRQGGDIGNLPAGGEMLVESQGILWISGNEAYFGEALSGIEPQGSIGPPVSPSPDPNAPPSNTPAPAIPASSPTPAPTQTRP